MRKAKNESTLQNSPKEKIVKKVTRDTSMSGIQVGGHNLINQELDGNQNES